VRNKKRKKTMMIHQCRLVLVVASGHAGSLLIVLLSLLGTRLMPMANL
jgi:hypothetical protein